MNRNVIEILIAARDQASQVLKANAQNLISIGAALTVATAAIVAGLGSSAQAAVQYQESMANTASVLHLARQEQEQLTQEILAFSRDTRAGPQAVAAAYYDIVGGIADASTHMAVLEAATRTAEAGNADLTATTSALVGIMNSYNFSADQAAFASNVLTQTVAKGVGTMNEFATALPQVTGLAASLDISFEQLGAQMAFLTTKGYSAAQSATMLKGMMSALINPSEQMKRLFNDLGIASGEQAIRQFGLAGTYDSLAIAAGRAGISLAAAVGQTEAYNGVIAVSSQQAADALNNFSVGLDNATESARNIQMQSTAAQLDLLRSSFEAIRIQVGDAMLPVINNIVGALRPMLDQLFVWIQANPQLMTTIVSLLGVVAGIGPVMTAAGLATRFLDMSMTALSGPFGLAIKLGSILAVMLISNVGGIRDVFVKDFFPIIQAVGDLFGALVGFLKPLLGELLKAFSSTIGVILNLLKPFLDILVGAIKLVTGFLKMLSGDVSGGLQSFTEGLGLNMPMSPAASRQQRAQQMAMQSWQQNNLGGLPGVSNFNMDTSGGSSQIANNQEWNINVQMPDSAMAGGFAAQQAGTDFGAAFAEEMQRLGVAPA